MKTKLTLCLFKTYWIAVCQDYNLQVYQCRPRYVHVQPTWRLVTWSCHQKQHVLLVFRRLFQIVLVHALQWPWSILETNLWLWSPSWSTMFKDTDFYIIILRLYSDCRFCTTEVLQAGKQQISQPVQGSRTCKLFFFVSCKTR